MTEVATKKEAKKAARRNSPGLDSWRRLWRRPVAVVSMVVLMIIIGIAIFADLIVPYSQAITPVGGVSSLLKPSAEHIFGTDFYGRDLFARVIHGTRIDILMSVSATAVSITLGTVLACLCAHFGGKVDNVIMRIADVLSSIPGLVMALAICAGIGRGMWQLIVAMIMGTIAIHLRMIRSAALGVGSMEYVESAKALGAKTGYILRRHYLHNVVSVILIQATQNISINITIGATLSFIGLGVKSPTPEWGMLLSEGLDYLMINPWAAIFPGIFVVVTALAVSTFGDCLRDALDPKLKGKA